MSCWAGGGGPSAASRTPAEVVTEPPSGRRAARRRAAPHPGGPGATYPSEGSVGDSYDNAMAETAMGLCKTHVVRRKGPWRDIEAVEMATLE